MNSVSLLAIFLAIGAILAVAIYASIFYFSRGSFKVITPDQLKAMLCKGMDLVILDVREPWEFCQGFIYRSINIPVRKLPSRLEEISGFREKRVVVVCKSGLRSRIVCAFLEKEGFSHPLHLKGGLRGWVKAGLKLIREEPAGGA